jgi:NitT/TauT family transport system substrate-binding protein
MTMIERRDMTEQDWAAARRFPARAETLVVGENVYTMHRTRALALIGAGAASVVTPGRAGAADVPLRLASIPIDGGAQCWYAQNLGYFSAAGIAPTIDSTTNGSAITAGVVGGSLDIGYSALLTLAVAYDKGVPLTIIAAAGNYLTSAPISALLVALDSPAKTARDLNGKTIGVNGLKNMRTAAIPRR